jgi:endonuclease/exonuclease/phosphatase family metal-dependent hydrolase
VTHTTIPTLRIATYNIAKGVQGVGPARRLEIHNLGHAVEQLDADVVCLQEVRKHNHQHARHFARWPEQPQADFLAPQGYEAVYQTNAFTRHGEHGNAVLSRWPVVSQQHEDMSDHPLEQRGLLHVTLHVQARCVHVVVLHLGLIAGSRNRQVAQLAHYLQREVPADMPLVVAGDFNDWGAQLRPPLRAMGLHDFHSTPPVRTFPARLPLAQLDYVYARGLQPLSVQVPRGRIWWRMSDHLPLMAEFAWLP